MSAPIIPANLLQKRSIDNRKVLYFNNREAYLAGIYPDIPNLDGVIGDTSSIAAGTVDYGPKMEFLAKNGNNFFRHWVIFYPNFIDEAKLKTDCGETSESVTSAGVPWRERYSPFFYTSPTWNLAEYNNDFFARLKLMIETAQEYGLVVQLTIFDRCGLDFDSADKCKRWPYSPWNAKRNRNELIRTPGGTSGVNKFYERNIAGVGTAGVGTTLGKLQDAYVDKLVTSTMDYPNVVYEIMNEPIHKPDDNVTPAQQMARRVKWADDIVGAIYRHTQGKRFIFYNDHSGLNSWEDRGRDVLHWKTQPPGTSNFAKLDGVIFHGNVEKVNPETLGWTFANNLIIQVSTDTFTAGNRDYHTRTTVNAFTQHMMFQAEAAHDETVADDRNAAAGIGDAVPAPTLFKLPPFIATWIKIGETDPLTGFPHMWYTQNADASMVVMNPDTDLLIQKGRVVQLYKTKIAFENEALQTVGVQDFTFDNNSQLKLKRTNNGTQTFKKYGVGPQLRPFLYQWKRISDTVTPPPPPFFVFFYPDGTLRVRNVSDFAVTNRAHVSFDTPQANQIRIKSETLHNDVVWNYSYSFTADLKELLTLTKVVAPGELAVTRVYERVI